MFQLLDKESNTGPYCLTVASVGRPEGMGKQLKQVSSASASELTTL